MKRFKNILTLSLWIILAASLAAFLYGVFLSRPFAYIFNANFLAGSAVILFSFIRMFLPVNIKTDKLTDHSTLEERFFRRHRAKRDMAYRYLFAGIFVIVIASLVQLVLSQIFR